MLLTAGGATTRVRGEVLTGAINGINAIFTTASDFVPASEAVIFNGLRQFEGVSNDYLRSESGGIGTGYDTITFAVVPRNRPGSKPDDSVLIDYDLA